jgi:hypothetical protein
VTKRSDFFVHSSIDFDSSIRVITVDLSPELPLSGHEIDPSNRHLFRFRSLREKCNENRLFSRYR